MNTKQAIRYALSKRDWSQKKLAMTLGKKQSMISKILSSKHGMRTDTFIRLMNSMGYDVLIKDNMSSDKPVILTVEEEDPWQRDTDMQE